MNQQSSPGQMLVAFRRDLDGMESGFSKVLPSHINVAKFRRVIETEMQKNPRLLFCDLHSLKQACMLAAQDGLLPDGKDGAIVYFKNKSGALIAQWMPMIGGIRKKVHQSGELLDWNVQVVFEGDLFDYELGDEPFIRHKPSLTGGRTRPVVGAYSIATYKNGYKSREFMNVDQIEDVRRATSRSEKGPWSNKVFYPEMCRKTVARLHAKQLPMSSDIEDIMHRDDELFRMDSEPPEHEPPRPGLSQRKSVGDVLDEFANGGETPPEPPLGGRTGTEDELAAAEQIDPETGEVNEKSEPEKPFDAATDALPATPAEYEDYVRDTLESFTNEAMLRAWWLSDMEKQLRTACGVDGVTMGRLKQYALARISVIKAMASADLNDDEYDTKGKW